MVESSPESFKEENPVMSADPPINILLVDDDQNQHILLGHILKTFRQRYELDWSPTYGLGWLQLQKKAYDVCLVDYNLLDANGLDFIRHALEQSIDVPMILLTGENKSDVDIEALKAGATDYIDKTDLNPRFIERALRYAVERHRSQRSLRESETLLRHVLNNVTVGVFILQNQRMVYANPTMTTITRYTPTELARMDFSELVHPDFHASLQLNEGKNDGLNRSTTLEAMLITKNHQKLWVQLHLSSIEYAGVSALLGTFINITHSKQMQVVIQESEKRFRSLVENSSDLIMLVDSVGTMQYVSPSIKRITGQTEQLFSGQNLFDSALGIIHPDDFETFWNTFHILRQHAANRVILRWRLRHMNGIWRWFEGTGTNLLAEPSVQAIVINARETTEAIRALEAETKQRIFAQALLDSVAALTSTLQFDEVLDRILTNAGNVISHDSANIMLIEQGFTRVVGYRVYDGATIEAKIRNSRFHVDSTPHLRQMTKTRQPVIISNTRNYPGWLMSENIPRWKSSISVPIILGDEVIGFINLDSYTLDFFNNEHAERLKVFANQAAIAIQNARLYEQAKHFAVAEERQRLARDLHDSVSQTLFSANVIAETLPILYENNPEEVKNGLQKLSKLTKGALAEMRTLLVELRPTALIGSELSTLLRHLVNSYLSRTDASIHLLTRGHEFFAPPDVHLCLYRLAQEALNNSIKHSQASQIMMNLEYRAESISLQIMDNGRGFKTEVLSENQMGIGIMFERAKTANVGLTINSIPNEGTQVIAIWQGKEEE